MKKIFFTGLFLLALFQISIATPDSMKFILLRMDYLTFQPKHLYYFQQPYSISNPAETEKIYHDLYVKIVPATDFGSTTIRSATTGEIVYDATALWCGTGQHISPTSYFEIDTVNNIIKPNPLFFDIETCYFSQNDSVHADSAWQNASKVIPLNLFETDNYNAFLYLHYFSVGANDPSSAEWIIIYYSLPENIVGKWTNISGDLPNLHINSIASHPFYTDSLLIGTNAGAFQTSDGGNHWNKIKFGENPDVRITQIRAEMHPILDWTVPVLWLGTEEFSMIPEDRLGRIFFSEDGGSTWINTYFPRIAVSALEVPTDSSLVAFAAAYNPFYYLDSFFAMDDTGWVEYDLTPVDTTVIRINCIEIDEKKHNQWFLATSNGVFATTNGGKNWNQTDPYHPSTAVVISPFNPSEVYAIQLFGTRSEGIYRSTDDGKSWKRRCWTVNGVTLISDRFVPGTWYWAVKNIGVFKSSDDCSTHVEISEGLKEKEILCLAQDRRNSKILYAGTTNGIFRYEEEPTVVWHHKNASRQMMPQNFKLHPAFPNPFNASTAIRLEIKKEQQIKLVIYNLLGQEIRTLYDGFKPAGNHQLIWDGKDNHGVDSTSGLYFCRLSVEREQELQTIKLVFVR